MSRITDRIERELGIPGLTEALADRIAGAPCSLCCSKSIAAGLHADRRLCNAKERLLISGIGSERVCELRRRLTESP